MKCFTVVAFILVFRPSLGYSNAPHMMSTGGGMKSNIGRKPTVQMTNQLRSRSSTRSSGLSRMMNQQRKNKFLSPSASSSSSLQLFDGGFFDITVPQALFLAFSAYCFTQSKDQDSDDFPDYYVDDTLPPASAPAPARSLFMVDDEGAVGEDLASSWPAPDTTNSYTPPFSWSSSSSSSSSRKDLSELLKLIAAHETLNIQASDALSDSIDLSAPATAFNPTRYGGTTDMDSSAPASYGGWTREVSSSTTGTMKPSFAPTRMNKVVKPFPGSYLGSIASLIPIDTASTPAPGLSTSGCDGSSSMPFFMSIAPAPAPVSSSSTNRPSGGLTSTVNSISIAGAMKRSSYAPTKMRKASKPFPGSYLASFAPCSPTDTSAPALAPGFSTTHGEPTSAPFVSSAPDPVPSSSAKPEYAVWTSTVNSLSNAGTKKHLSYAPTKMIKSSKPFPGSYLGSLSPPSATDTCGPTPAFNTSTVPAAAAPSAATTPPDGGQTKSVDSFSSSSISKRPSYAPSRMNKDSKPFPGSYLGSLGSVGSSVASPRTTASTDTKISTQPYIPPKPMLANAVAMSSLSADPVAPQHSSSRMGSYLDSLSPNSSSGRPISYYVPPKASGFRTSTDSGTGNYLDSMSRGLAAASYAPTHQSCGDSLLGYSSQTMTAASNNRLPISAPYMHSAGSTSAHSSGSYLDAISGESGNGSARQRSSYAPTKPSTRRASAVSVSGSYIDQLMTAALTLAPSPGPKYPAVSSSPSGVSADESANNVASYKPIESAPLRAAVYSPSGSYLDGFLIGGSPMKSYATNGTSRKVAETGWNRDVASTLSFYAPSNGVSSPHSVIAGPKASEVVMTFSNIHNGSSQPNGTTTIRGRVPNGSTKQQNWTSFGKKPTRNNTSSGPNSYLETLS